MMESHLLSSLKGGDEVMALYRRGENIVLAGSHNAWRDYRASDARAREVWALLDERVKRCVEENELNPSKKWVLGKSILGEWELQEASA